MEKIPHYWISDILIEEQKLLYKYGQYKPATMADLKPELASLHQCSRINAVQYKHYTGQMIDKYDEISAYPFKLEVIEEVPCEATEFIVNDYKKAV